MDPQLVTRLVYDSASICNAQTIVLDPIHIHFQLLAKLLHPKIPLSICNLNIIWKHQKAV